MIDVQLLLKKLRRVENDLENLSKVSSQQELMESIQRFGISAKDLEAQAGKRQQELMDPAMRDDLVSKIWLKHLTDLTNFCYIFAGCCKSSFKEAFYDATHS
jgi:hypothetical protein